MVDEYRTQLYPNQMLNKVKEKDGENEEILELYSGIAEKFGKQWQYKSNIDELVPAECDIKKIYSLIMQIINIKTEEKRILEKEELKELNKRIQLELRDVDLNSNVKELLRGIYSGKIKDNDKVKTIDLNGKKINFGDENLKIDVVKGSIYKIKSYYLEDSKIKDIRGGSLIIDHLNISVARDILLDRGFTEDNLIFCGGGNVFIVVPHGYGKELCRKYEEKFSQISLTAKSAFDYISCTLGELLYNFKYIKGKIEAKVIEKSKLKIYEVNPDCNREMYKCSGINLSFNEKKYYINFDKYLNSNNYVNNGICELCHIRDAKFLIKNKADTIKVCSSCGRKYLTGSKPEIFLDMYEDEVRKWDKEFEINKEEQINSVDDIDSEIAVIYGDGNNMGNVVKYINNIFEMMYFSRKTDIITKAVVYKAIHKSMKNNPKFQVIGLGGDDIFIIVPAKYAFAISKDIIKMFDELFNNQITMSVGIAIGKKNTPISNLFTLAQGRLKSAKEYVKEHNLREGTVDVVELIGDMHISKNKYNNEIKSLFPVSNSNFEILLDAVSKFKENNVARTQLYKIGYAKENMIKEEFELFYYYQNSKQKQNKRYTIDEFINTLIDKSENKNNVNSKKDVINIKRQEPYAVDWNNLILLYERGVNKNE